VVTCPARLHQPPPQSSSSDGLTRNADGDVIINGNDGFNAYSKEGWKWRNPVRAPLPFTEESGGQFPLSIEVRTRRG
jgi:hypothetical protein